MNLASAFAASANRHLDKIALFWGDQQFSYARILEQSGGMAHKLTADFGVKAGDRVGLWLKNCPEFVMSFVGDLKPQSSTFKTKHKS